MKKFKKIIFFIIGTLSLSLGIVGIFLPLLPTTPFILLAAFCYAESSKWLNDWIHTNRWFGNYISGYKTGKGITIKHKVLVVLFLWVSIIYSIVFILNELWSITLLITIALIVTIHVYAIKTRMKDKKKFD